MSLGITSSMQMSVEDFQQASVDGLSLVDLGASVFQSYWFQISRIAASGRDFKRFAMLQVRCLEPLKPPISTSQTTHHLQFATRTDTEAQRHQVNRCKLKFVCVWQVQLRQPEPYKELSDSDSWVGCPTLQTFSWTISKRAGLFWLDVAGQILFPPRHRAITCESRELPCESCAECCEPSRSASPSGQTIVQKTNEIGLHDFPGSKTHEFFSLDDL